MAIAKNSGSKAQGFELQAMRQNTLQLHQKCNASLHGTFKGTLEEQVVKTAATGMSG
jgi:hypothetical protein